jgi:hypothetical protein
MLELIQRSQAEYQAFIDHLPDAEKSATGTADQWSVKDIVAHLAFWMETMNERLTAAKHGQVPAESRDFNALNAEAFEKRRGLSWAQAVDAVDNAFKTLTALIQDFSDEELSDPKRYPWLNGRPLTGSIAGNSFGHVYEHIADYHVKHGNMERANEIMEMVSAQYSEDADPDERGVTRYNLACFYAKTGQAAKALALLPEALRLAPRLVEWSKEDSDLAALRSEPGYKALYQD